MYGYTLLEVFIPGNPKTKGSLDFRGAGRVVENVRGSKAWRMLMAYSLRQQWNGDTSRAQGVAYELREPESGAVRVSATFHLPCARGARSLITKGSGDVDKLARNLLDALTDAGVINDDAQVTGIVIDKVEAARPGDRRDDRRDARPPGVHVTVWQVP